MPSIRRFLPAGLVIAFGLFFVYLIASSLIGLSKHKEYGFLTATAVKNSTISVSQSGHEAAIIGHGQAKVYLKPGEYVIGASSDAGLRYKAILLGKKQKVNVDLTNAELARLRSPDSITFKGTDLLVERGISQEQLNYIRLAVFKFAPKANTAVVSSSNITRSPRNGASELSIKFDISIDSSKYNAVLTYSDLSSIVLRLYKPLSVQIVFDSGRISKPAIVTGD